MHLGLVVLFGCLAFVYFGFTGTEAEPVRISNVLKKTVANPLSKTVANPLSKTVANPLSKTGANPFSKTGANPFSKTGVNPFSKTVANPLSKTGANPLSKDINPTRGIGGSGKRQHFIMFPNRKSAKDAARNAGKGNPVHDTAHKPGQNPHFHTADQNGKRLGDGAHYMYPKKRG